jgi:hypothetical protein
MRKSNLPLIRRKMAAFGDIAIRGTNKLHEKTNGKTYNGFHNHFIFSKKLLDTNTSTRDLISRIGNAVNDAMHYAFKYSGFQYKLVGNKFSYKYNSKDKPTVVFVMSKEGIGFDANLLKTTLSSKFEIPGSENILGLTYSGGILADKKNVFSVTIDKKDLIDLNSALSEHFKKLEANNQKIYGKEINADYFLTNFLVRRIISKALVKYRKREKN